MPLLISLTRFFFYKQRFFSAEAGCCLFSNQYYPKYTLSYPPKVCLKCCLGVALSFYTREYKQLSMVFYICISGTPNPSLVLLIKVLYYLRIVTYVRPFGPPKTHIFNKSMLPNTSEYDDKGVYDKSIIP